MASDLCALVLGASSGFGAATSRQLARSGYHIFGVHLDLRTTLPKAQQVAADIEATGRRAVFFNVNAADHEKRAQVVQAMREELGGGDSYVKVMLHSLAFGTLLPFVAEDPKDAVSPRQMEMTLDVMAHSLVYWVQDLYRARLLRAGSRVLAMTSAGSTRVIRHYGAVSAAKAALESHVRQLAVELAPAGIAVNAVRAGVTDTPAMRRIPEAVRLYEEASRRNPSGRATTPEDVARAIAALADDRLAWMTGGVIGVDGGEDITV